MHKVQIYSLGKNIRLEPLLAPMINLPSTYQKQIGIEFIPSHEFIPSLWYDFTGNYQTQAPTWDHLAITLYWCINSISPLICVVCTLTGREIWVWLFAVPCFIFALVYMWCHVDQYPPNKIASQVLIVTHLTARSPNKLLFNWIVDKLIPDFRTRWWP